MTAPLSTKHGSPAGTGRPEQPSVATLPLESRRPPVFRNRWERKPVWWEWEQREGEDGNKLLPKKAPRNTATPTRFEQEEVFLLRRLETNMQDDPESRHKLWLLYGVSETLQARKRKGRRTLSPLPSSSCSKLCRNWRIAQGGESHGMPRVRASPRASGLIKLHCRSKRPPRRPKHASISRTQAASTPRLLDSSTRAEQRPPRGSDGQAWRRRQPQVKKLCGFHRPVQTFLQKHQDGWTVPAPDTHPPAMPILQTRAAIKVRGSRGLFCLPRPGSSGAHEKAARAPSIIGSRQSGSQTLG